MREAHPTRQVLARGEVRTFYLAQFSAALGHSLLRSALSWHMWKTTGSYAFLGWLGLVEFLPVIPGSLLGGAVADNRDRRAILLTTVTASLCCAVVLALATGADSAVPFMLVMAAALVLAMTFQNPAMSALLPSLVPAHLFPAATVVSANVRNVARMSGPVVMGAIAAQHSIAAAYAAAAGIFVLAVLAAWRLPRRPASGHKPPVSWSSITEGIAFVRSRHAVLGSMLLDMVAVIFAGATAMLPVYADEILGVGELGYGLLSASMQVGTLVTAALLLMRPNIVTAGRWLLWAVLFFGLATIVFGLSRSYPLSVAALVLAGMADQVSMTARSIIVQLSTPDELRGRVSSVNMIFIGASNELGAAESGFLAALTTATFSVVAGGVACLGALGLIGLRMPALRQFRAPAIDERT